MINFVTVKKYCVSVKDYSQRLNGKSKNERIFYGRPDCVKEFCEIMKNKLYELKLHFTLLLQPERTDCGNLALITPVILMTANHCFPEILLINLKGSYLYAMVEAK